VTERNMDRNSRRPWTKNQVPSTKDQLNARPSHTCRCRCPPQSGGSPREPPTTICRSACREAPSCGRRAAQGRASLRHTDEARQDGQPRGVGRRPTLGTAAARVALVAIVHERDGGARLRAADAHVGDAVRRRVEVGMRRAGASDAVDERRRLRIDRRCADVLIPSVVGREERTSVEVVSQGHRRAAHGRRGRGTRA